MPLMQYVRSPMPACFNCRANVLAGSERCPSCGVAYVPGTLQAPLTVLRARSSGWGLSATIRQGVGFRIAALLVPIWVPPLLVLIANGPPLALALLLAPFVFTPGLYTIANFSSWPPFARVVACFAYVALTGVVGFAAMSWFTEFAHRL